MRNVCRITDEVNGNAEINYAFHLMECKSV